LITKNLFKPYHQTNSQRSIFGIQYFLLNQHNIFS